MSLGLTVGVGEEASEVDTEAAVASQLMATRRITDLGEGTDASLKSGVASYLYSLQGAR